ncbi:uncharacterized protein BXZ73DRAFT_78857 [Epithele typhae]|uniref:uncharacterized protein n=1 Tax=Epithele typhae TaxID=378194 RepID=UPI0020076380|nr:uncharacterized protein BXZ73DRAFT_78857 [Epithele typhae]KAH9925875.1 hypothetical protein BXZ73DRAFT_78857 [Epithele typhae]
MKFTALSAILLAASAVHAQSTTSSASTSIPSGVTPCILNCVSQAASAAGCSGFSDLACVCTNTQFQQQAQSCLESSCTPAEVAAAQALQSSECLADVPRTPHVVARFRKVPALQSEQAVMCVSHLAAFPFSSAVSSVASSITSSASSAISSKLSSAGSSLSSAAASLTSGTSASGSNTGAARTSSAAGALRAEWGLARGGAAALAVAVVGVVAGAAMVF